MTWDQLEASIATAIDEVVDTNTQQLNQEFKAEEPIATGASKAGWIRLTTANGYQVVNPVTSASGFHYPQLLFDGSSEQLPLGHYPTYFVFLERLRNDLENINI